MKPFTSLILTTVLLIATSFLLTGAQPTADPADQLLGTFWAPDKDGKIEMYKKNGKYWGKLTWGNNTDLKD
ncbi:MAG: hypothetical protein AAFR59_19295, partial [Bacteroidota bacterium]